MQTTPLAAALVRDKSQANSLGRARIEGGFIYNPRIRVKMCCRRRRLMGGVIIAGLVPAET